ncbi:MAG: alcohol dehydrogenase catalytic domain-containing protein [Pseudomonadota bacterium]
MRAAILHSFNGDLSVEEWPEPRCPEDGAVVTVEACGVCRSDHHAWTGADPDVVLPHIMGHEMAGTVREVGPACRGFTPGDRVTAPFILGCGHCADCRDGQPTVCAQQDVIGFTVPGAFAEAVAVPHADFNLVRLPDALAFDAAAGMGCRVTTAWRALTDRAGLAPGEWLVVHGCGGVGLSAVMIGAALGASVLAVDIKEDALAMAAALGATATLNAASVEHTGDAVRTLTGGGAHVSLDALGTAITFDASLRSLRKLGRHVQIGMPVGAHATLPLPLLELVYARQLSLSGTRGLGAPQFRPLLEMVASGRLDPSRLITRRIALSDTQGALEAMSQGQAAGVAVITDFAS